MIAPLAKENETYEVDQSRTATKELDGGDPNDPTDLPDSGIDSLKVRIANTHNGVPVTSNVITVEVSITGANDAPNVAVASADTTIIEKNGNTTSSDPTAGGQLTYNDDDEDHAVSALKVYLETSSTATTTTNEVTASTPGEVQSAGFSGDGTSNVGTADRRIADSTPNVPAGSYGEFTFTMTTAGTLDWTFELDESAVGGLLAGDTATAETWVRVVDGFDLSSAHHKVSVTITGVEDAPILSASQTGAVVEDGTASDTGTFTVTDQDYDDQAGFSASDLTLQGFFGTVTSSSVWAAGSDTANSNKGTSFAGMYGTFYLQADGDWIYELDNDATAVDELDGRVGSRAADTLTETLNVRVADTDGDDSVVQEITVTITGANDDPVLVEGPAASGTALGTTLTKAVTEGTDRTVVTINATDVDADNTGFTYTLGGVDVGLFET